PRPECRLHGVNSRTVAGAALGEDFTGRVSWRLRAQLFLILQQRRYTHTVGLDGLATVLDGPLPTVSSKILKQRTSGHFPLALATVEQLVSALAFRNQFTSEDLEPGMFEPPGVRSSVGVTPVHLGSGTQPPRLSAGPRGRSSDEDERTPRPDPSADAVEQVRLFLYRNVNDRVEANRSIKTSGQESDLGHVRVKERSLGDELAGASDLHVRNVDSNHVESAR